MSSFQKHHSGAKYTKYNQVALIRGGKEYFTLLENIIDEANSLIHLQVYIFNEDETGNRIINALLRAAGRGVKIFIVVDGYASRNISKACMNHLKSAGIHFRWFNPVFKSRYFYFGRRLHHKVIVADELVSLVGGVNITNRYNDFDNPAWLDWAVHVRGEVSLNLSRICADIWNKSGGVKSSLTKTRQPFSVLTTSGNCFVRARVNDWVRNKNQISNSYIEMLKHAQKSVIIISSYFLPGHIIRKHLSAAAKRGVAVKIIVAGVSDVSLAKYAERYMYHWLLKNNIEIFEYKKTVLHGKLSTCDDMFVTAGSYNLNNISAYASIELNLDILDIPFAKATRIILQKIIREDCRQIKEADHRVEGNVWTRARQRISYNIYRLLLYLFTFYFKKQHG